MLVSGHRLGLKFRLAVERLDLGRAVAYLRKAVAAYKECLARPPMPDAQLWRVAAESDVEGATALLVAAGETDDTRLR